MTAEELKKERLALGLTQEALGKILGYGSFLAVNRKENGHHPISKQDVIIITMYKRELELTKILSK